MLESILIEKCKTGDGDAFGRLINNYSKQLLGYFWRYSNTQFETEEMFQETLIKVWKGVRKYDEKKKFSSWLFTIAHNVAMDSLRKRKFNNLSSLEIVKEDHSFSKPDEEVIKNEMIELINKAIHNLSDKQRAVFLLRQHSRMTFKEISETTREPLNTVISHMHYAIKKIKKQLDMENEPRAKSVI